MLPAMWRWAWPFAIAACGLWLGSRLGGDIPAHPETGITGKDAAAEHVLEVVDMSHLAGHNGPTSRAQALESLLKASREVGVARLVNHTAGVGVAKQAGRDYFGLPMGVKACAGCSVRNASIGFQRGYIPFAAESGLAEILEVKEGFCYGYEWPPEKLPIHPFQAANVWPPVEALEVLGSGWREAMMNFFNQSVAVAIDVVAALGEALGRRGEDLMSLNEGGDTISQMRLFHYMPAPARSEKKCMGSSPHTDWHVVTIIARDAESMLQYKDQHTGHWVNATLGAPGELILLIGDWLSVYSGREFHSAAHRVLLPEKESSLAFVLFLNPAPNARLPAAQRLATNITGKSGQQGESLNTVEADFFDLTWGEYVVRKWAKVMSNR